MSVLRVKSGTSGWRQRVADWPTCPEALKHSGRLMIVGPNIPVSMKCKTDKPGRHKDGSGHHHPMGIFPIEQQMEHFPCPLSRYFPFLSPGFTSRAVGLATNCMLSATIALIAVPKRRPLCPLDDL